MPRGVAPPPLVAGLLVLIFNGGEPLDSQVRTTHPQLDGLQRNAEPAGAPSHRQTKTAHSGIVSFLAPADSGRGVLRHLALHRPSVVFPAS